MTEGSEPTMGPSLGAKSSAEHRGHTPRGELGSQTPRSSSSRWRYSWQTVIGMAGFLGTGGIWRLATDEAA